MANNKFILKKYDSLEELNLAMWDGEITKEELKDVSFDAVDLDGNYSTVSSEDGDKAIEELGYYGFVTQDKVIHYWIGKEIPFEELLYFVGHEIGHMIGKPIEALDDKDLMVKEERRADEYAEVAKTAYILTKEMINNG